MANKKAKSEYERSHMYFRIAVITYLVIQCFIILALLILTYFSRSPYPGTLLFTVVTISPLLIFAVFSFAAIITSISTYFLSKKFLKPLEELSKMSKEVAKGNFDVRVNEDAEFDELRTTLMNFNLMVKELSKVETLSNSFVSNVSHEFKTPLSVIRSNVNLLQSGELNEDEQKECLKQIDSHVENLSNLVSNVLRICKLNDGKTEIIKKPYRLDEQIRQTIVYYLDKIEAKHIELQVDLDDTVIDSDEELLTQVWSNIISNAIKFSKDNSVINISLKLVDNKFVEVKFVDHGEGMSSEDQKRIFDRFYQGETSHQKEGNGLGLSIVAAVCKKLKIKVDVASKLNEGTTFTFTFKEEDYRPLSN